MRTRIRLSLYRTLVGPREFCLMRVMLFIHVKLEFDNSVIRVFWVVRLSQAPNLIYF